jgi:3D (Asp-Asp-Asp) domain-containing protein
MDKPTKSLILVLVGMSTIVGVLLVGNVKDQQTIEKQNKLIHNKDEKIKSLTEQVRDLNTKIEGKDIKIEELNESVEGLKNRIEGMQQKNQQLTDEINKLKKEKKELTSRGKNKRETKIFEVTAYTAGHESTGKTPNDPLYGVTASGKKVQEGVTVACPPSMKFGTKLYIEGVGYRVCEDRGGAIKEGRLDVYMNSLKEALEFGRRKLKVRILKEG